MPTSEGPVFCHISELHVASGGAYAIDAAKVLVIVAEFDAASIGISGLGLG
jgi:hypothetical protein